MISPVSKKSKRALVSPALERECINTVRVLAADMVQAANSGHPGAPMGCAPLAHVLWTMAMDYSPANPDWMGRDRFVLSNGHACALQYVMLYLTGYTGVGMEDLKSFRQVGSKTPGHPENFVTDGVEVCTGPLGQGISNAVGMAMGERHLAATFNRPGFDIFDNYTYVICGDGCLQEGVSSEASSLAGHLGLGRLIVLYDDNKITIDGSTDLSFTEDVCKRYESYGWHVQVVDSVAETTDALAAAVEAARAEKSRPSFIKVTTVIGHGSVNEGSEKTHGAPLGAVDVAAVKTKFGMDPEKSFQVSADVLQTYRAAGIEGDALASDWKDTMQRYREAYPDLAKDYDRRLQFGMPETDLAELLPTFKEGDKDMATRKFSQACLKSVAPSMPELVGGSADLSGSNLTFLGLSRDFQKDSYDGRYIRFGVREHAMAALCNGMFAYGLLRPFCATFLVFSGYAMGSIRCSALSKFGVIYIMTHDSIGLGEDGPTHQPVETLETLRSIPNTLVLRPCDANEVSAAYMLALRRPYTPSVISLTRQTVTFQRTTAATALQGGYTLISATSPVLILVGTGSEVGLCSEAAKILTQEGIATSVVSMLSMEVFMEQTPEHWRKTFPAGVPVLSVEASSVNGWHKYSHAQVGMTRFGASGPGNDLFKKFGFTTENVAEKGRKLVKFYKKAGSVPDLLNRPDF
mmetsp:Transcript_35771/g.83222  ORF Transcript_35771/g.83222 Transcript_35771/m.83222 type:complete len:690 (-) Transcript_35771:183-2252(-)